jgi:8-oxo-dGTP pyrophosphatase MutT (NUDIX family)
MSKEKRTHNGLRIMNRQIVSGFIISSDKKILFGKKKSKGGVYPDMLHIPGGGIEPGESESDALKREIFEETGIDITNAKTAKICIGYGASEKTLSDGEVVWCEMTFNKYQIKVNQPAQKIKISPNDDLADFCWLTRDEIISEKNLVPGTAETLEQIDFEGAENE